MIIAELKLPLSLDELQRILREHGVLTASVFGSYARGQASEASDLDLLVDYRDGVSLFDHFDLKDALQQASGKDVDVVSARAVSRHLQPFIDREKVSIL